jgi:hypothetical protein
MSDRKDDEMKKNVVDGFDGVENDSVQDEEGRPSSNRVIQGSRLGFANDYKWLIGDDEEFSKTRELVHHQAQ